MICRHCGHRRRDHYRWKGELCALCNCNGYQLGVLLTLHVLRNQLRGRV